MIIKLDLILNEKPLVKLIQDAPFCGVDEGLLLEFKDLFTLITCGGEFQGVRKSPCENGHVEIACDGVDEGLLLEFKDLFTLITCGGEFQGVRKSPCENGHV